MKREIIQDGEDVSDDESDDKTIIYTRKTVYPLHIIVVTAVTIGKLHKQKHTHTYFIIDEWRVLAGDNVHSCYVMLDVKNHLHCDVDVIYGCARQQLSIQANDSAR
jgi:hypothetical protein